MQAAIFLFRWRFLQFYKETLREDTSIPAIIIFWVLFFKFWERHDLGNLFKHWFITSEHINLSIVLISQVLEVNHNTSWKSLRNKIIFLRFICYFSLYPFQIWDTRTKISWFGLLWTISVIDRYKLMLFNIFSGKNRNVARVRNKSSVYGYWVASLGCPTL